MRKIFKSKLIVLSMLVALIMCAFCPEQVEAKTKTYQEQNYWYGGSCSAVVSGDKVYYSITETGRIFCYNIKTKKTRTVIKSEGKGFSNLRKVGDYLYAVHDIYGGSDGNDRYIVRVSLKNGKRSVLAKGSDYVISVKNKKIYYIKTKSNDSYGTKYDTQLGTYSMTLTGKNKKRERSVVIKTSRDERSVIKTSNGSIFTKGKNVGSLYFPRSLWYKSPKGKTRVIYDMDKDKRVPSYSSFDYYTLQRGYIVYKRTIQETNGAFKGQLVLVKTNGKGARVIYSHDSVSGW